MKYNYLSTRDCAFAQFLKDGGHRVAFVGSRKWRDKSGKWQPIPAGLIMPLVQQPYTFGALRERILTSQENNND